MLYKPNNKTYRCYLQSQPQPRHSINNDKNVDDEEQTCKQQKRNNQKRQNDLTCFESQSSVRVRPRVASISSLFLSMFSRGVALALVEARILHNSTRSLRKTRPVCRKLRRQRLVVSFNGCLVQFLFFRRLLPGLFKHRLFEQRFWVGDGVGLACSRQKNTGCEMLTYLGSAGQVVRCSGQLENNKVHSGLIQHAEMIGRNSKVHNPNTDQGTDQLENSNVHAALIAKSITELSRWKKSPKRACAPLNRIMNRLAGKHYKHDEVAFQDTPKWRTGGRKNSNGSRTK